MVPSGGTGYRQQINNFQPGAGFVRPDEFSTSPAPHLDLLRPGF
jgi:hypothetical protein